MSIVVIVVVVTAVGFSDVMRALAAEETEIIDVYSEEVVVSEAVKEEELGINLVETDEPEEAPEETQEEDPELTMYYTEDDVDLLGRLITKKAGALSYEEQRAVADTVINRLNLDKWPDTVTEVITQPGQYATSLPNEASEEAKEVAFSALDQWNLTKNGYNSEEEWDLPEEYVYFFGNGQHNYFYYYENGELVFFDALPNEPLPADILSQYREIVRETDGASQVPQAETETEEEMYWEESEVEAENATENLIKETEEQAPGGEIPEMPTTEVLVEE